MEFDKSKAFSSINADEVKVGSIGYAGSTYDELYYYVTHDSKKKVKLIDIKKGEFIKRFLVRNRNKEEYAYFVFYLLEEPKETKDNYRPYKNIDEWLYAYCGEFGFFKSSSGFPIWVKDVNTGIVRMITEYSTIDNTVRTGDYWCSMEELLEDYTYLDGTKCGIKEE